ncbi:MAG: universal stress protein [Candidatus Methanomethylophilus sp.]|nr:universal stress protein [Methanomethylophilus sp.]MDD4222008.1 universal stress protein [Methanomethylophilus sp.]MDD4668852.1 universal stress protein [Methanomethylophilus sp.]
MNFQNILVPTDGSVNTHAAIARAVELAKITGGRITALYVKDKNADENTAREATAYVAAQGKAAGIAVTELTLSGTPAEVIAAESPKYDVIVMGTLGRTGMKKALMGSVAETVVKHAVIPVIVVRNTV